MFSAVHSQNPTVTLGDAVAVGQEVKVPLFVFNATDLMGLELRIIIDRDVLEYARIEDIKLPGQVVANYSQSQERLVVIWTAPVTNPPVGVTPAGKIFDIVFNFTGTADATISIVPETSYLLDTALNKVPNVSFVDATVSPDPSDGAVAMTQILALQNSPVIMPVTFSGKGFGTVTSFTLRISYDTAAFDYTGVEAMPGITGVTASVSQGVITITRTGTALDLRSPTHVLDIKLFYKGNSTQNLDFLTNSQVASGANQLQVNYENGNVFYTEEGALLYIDDIDLYVDNINPAGTPLQVPIKAAGFVPVVGSINFSVEFNNQQLTYTGFTAQQLTNWNVNAQASRLTFTWTGGATGQAILNGNLITLNFTYAAPVNSDLTFDSNSIFRGINFATIPVSYDGATIAITDVKYSLSLSAQPGEGGTVTGAGQYAPGTAVVFEAVAAEGYAFVNWTTSEGEVFSVNARDTIVMDADVSLIANFNKLEFTLTVDAAPEEGGTVTGGGIFMLGEQVTITAEPAEGYEFINWTDAEEQVFATTLSRTFAMPANNLALTANFQLIGYTVTLQVSPLGSGTVTGAGTYNLNDEVTIVATPATGYAFVNWTDLQGVGITTEQEYSFNMPGSNVTYVANFVRVFTVTLNVNMKFVDGYYHPFNFDANADKVFVTGSMIEWAAPGTPPADQPMVATTADPMIYTKTITVPVGEYFYKYYLNEGMAQAEWGDDKPDRSFVVVSRDITLNDWFGSRDNPTNVRINVPGEMKVYPNPVRNILFVESPVTISEIRLIDMLGQVVYAEWVNDYRSQLNVSNFRRSLYFLQVFTADGMQTHRIQVVN